MNQQIIDKDKEIQITKIYNAIRNLSQSEDAHWVETPASLVDEMISNINLDGKILVLFNVDIMMLLLKVYEVPASDIIFLSDDLVKDYLCDKKLGVKYINSIEELKEMNMKFDVVIGNPPYQTSTNTMKDENNRQGSFWWKIVSRAMPLVNDGGVISMVVPSSMFSTGGFGSSSHKVTNMVKNGFNLTNVWSSLDDYFNVGIKISAFTAVKGTSNTCLIVDKGHNVTIDYSYPIPFIIDKNTTSIVKKCYNLKNRWSFTEVDKSSPKDLVVKLNGGRFKKYDKLFVGISGDSPHKHQTLVLSSDANLDNIESIFKSKLFKFMFIILGGEAGQSSTGILQSLPSVDVNKKWIDTELYEFFDLSKEEIDYIESNI